MKRSVLLILLFVASLSQAQQIDQISVGAGYANQTYYSLSGQNSSSSPIEDWDIAFNMNPMDASIFINEGVASGSSAQGALAVWVTTSTDFATATLSDTAEALRNPDVSWSEGAFNTPAVASNPADFGWGTYDFTTHEVNGTRVFIIELRNGVYKKFMVESLINGTYTFKWADIDGGGLVTRTLDQTAYAKDIVFFSIEDDMVVDIEPNNWDLIFTRYSETLDAGDGTTLEYNVGGALIAPGVLVAQANGVDPTTVTFASHEADLTDSLNVIGHDWRYFDLGSFSWITLTNRVYFVKTASDSLFKMTFLDFEGSSTGVITFETEYLGQYVSVSEYEELAGFAMYPNPAVGRVNLTLDWQDAPTTAQYRILDLQGRVVAQEAFEVAGGFNQQVVELNFAPGLYVVDIVAGNARTTERLVIQ